MMVKARNDKPRQRFQSRDAAKGRSKALSGVEREEREWSDG